VNHRIFFDSSKFSRSFTDALFFNSSAPTFANDFYGKAVVKVDIHRGGGAVGSSLGSYPSADGHRFEED
jgi:hypothetical protein